MALLIAGYVGVALILALIGLWFNPQTLTPDVAQWEHRLFIEDQEKALRMQDLIQRTKVAVAVATVKRSGRAVTHMPQPDRLAHLTAMANLAARTPRIQRAIEKAKTITAAKRHAAATR